MEIYKTQRVIITTSIPQTYCIIWLVARKVFGKDGSRPGATHTDLELT